MNAPGRPQLAFPKPGKVLKRVLIVYFAVWLIFTLGMNWGGVSSSPLIALMADPAAILQGEVWRLFTAAWVPTPSVFSLLITLFLLYMFGAQLEEDWGGKRFGFFLLWTGVIAYGVQALLAPLLPAFLAGRLLVPGPAGAAPILEAVIVAWALTHPERTIYFFLVVPMKGITFIYLTIAFNILTLIALESPGCGHIAMFAGMGAGWLLGAGTPSPLRRYYLKYRLGRLEREAAADRKARKKRVKRSGFEVIKGGEDKDRPPKDMLN